MKKTKTVQRTVTTETRTDGKTVRTETIVTTVDDPKDLDNDSSLTGRWTQRVKMDGDVVRDKSDDRSLWEMVFGRDRW